MIRKPRIYVCAPYSAGRSFDVRRNVIRAQEAAAEIHATQLAWAVVPHNMGAGIQDTLPEYEWYDYTLAEMATCHAVYVLRGFKLSRGCRDIEIPHALDWNLPLCYEQEDRLSKWIFAVSEEFKRRGGRV